MRHPLLNWLFYGHIWIALAALGLSWQSTYLASGNTALGTPHYFVFFATLGVYTLHRLLSYRRAGSEPDGRRYRLVARQPLVSLAVGVSSLGVALIIAVTFPLASFVPVIIALPFTLFYLIPIYPGGPRMRDLPYLKVVWVALAWTLMTDVFPLAVISVDYVITLEPFIRFALVIAIALLFDTRDVALDRRQGVHTLVADHPKFNRLLAVSLLIGCALVSLLDYPNPQAYTLAVCYFVGAYMGSITRAGRGEDFYAVYIDGLLLLPPFSLMISLP